MKKLLLSISLLVPLSIIAQDQQEQSREALMQQLERKQEQLGSFYRQVSEQEEIISHMNKKSLHLRGEAAKLIKSELLKKNPKREIGDDEVSRVIDDFIHEFSENFFDSVRTIASQISNHSGVNQYLTMYTFCLVRSVYEYNKFKKMLLQLEILSKEWFVLEDKVAAI